MMNFVWQILPLTGWVQMADAVLTVWSGFFSLHICMAATHHKNFVYDHDIMATLFVGTM